MVIRIEAYYKKLYMAARHLLQYYKRQYYYCRLVVNISVRIVGKCFSYGMRTCLSL